MVGNSTTMGASGPMGLVFRRREPISAQLWRDHQTSPAITSSLPRSVLDRLWVPPGQQASRGRYETV